MDYTCHYISKENKWVVVAETFLAIPDSELKRIGLMVRHEWMQKLKEMQDLKDTLKMSHIRRALRSLEDNGIVQVRGVIKANKDDYRQSNSN